MAQTRGKKSSAKRNFDLSEFIGEYERPLDAGSAVADFYAMALTISSKGFEAALRTSLQGVEADLPGTDVVAAVAHHLSRKINGLNADIVRKAVQETMFDAAGLEYDLKKLNVKSGLEKYLRRHGTRHFLELFLSRYVFNVVWLRIQEPVRAKSGSQSLAKSMNGVEQVCSSVVKSVLDGWQAEGKLEGLATKKRLGTTLMKTIETRLLQA